MRDAFHEDLAAVSGALLEMSRLAGSAMSRATTALLDADLELAEGVIAADLDLDALYRSTEERAYELLARQQPVARDLRAVVTSLRMIVDLERMGDNAVAIARTARRRAPASAVPPELRATVVRMGHTAEEIVAKAGDVIARRDVSLALQLESDDDVMDELHRSLLSALLEPGWQHGTQAAVDLSLAGRHYERFADHAVSVARRVVYLVTGERALPDVQATAQVTAQISG